MLFILFDFIFLQQANKQIKILLDEFTTIHINPFIPNAAFLYPQKTSKNLTVFLCFLEVEKGCIGNKWVKWQKS